MRVTVHGVLGEAQGRQLPSRGTAVEFLLAGLWATAWSWIIVTNFRGLGDRMLKGSQDSTRRIPLAGPALRRANMRLLGSQETIDKAGASATSRLRGSLPSQGRSSSS